MSESNNLSYLSLIRIHGPDAEKFLQGQLTCDIHKLTPQQNILGAYCNYKGRVIAIFRLFLRNNNYYLLLPKSILENTFSTFKKYAMFSKVTLDIVDDFRVISDDPLFNSSNHLNDETQWRLFNIQQGIPTIYPQTNEMFTPHMLNLPELGAVSFNKGCYLGQEVIARTEYLGKSKRQMFQKEIISNKTLSPGEEVYNEASEKIGIIVDAVKTDINKYLALIVG
jgi:folate-binding protein YgfZ